MNKKEGLISRNEIFSLIKNKELIITPLLDESQIGQISIDLRVGTDFLTSQKGREPYIDATNDEFNNRPIKSFFTETRRHVGEPFLIHPNQTILFSSLEYIKLPNDVFAILSCRSSFSRLGLSISTIAQPGYCGCLSIEMLYSGSSPIKIMSGTRLLQIRLYRLDATTSYFETSRKYACQVRPIPSKANEDKDLFYLKEIAKIYN
jgi:dCTP deaminase